MGRFQRERPFWGRAGGESSLHLALSGPSGSWPVTNAGTETLTGSRARKDCRRLALLANRSASFYEKVAPPCAAAQEVPAPGRNSPPLIWALRRCQRRDLSQTCCLPSEPIDCRQHTATFSLGALEWVLCMYKKLVESNTAASSRMCCCKAQMERSIRNRTACGWRALQLCFDACV